MFDMHVIITFKFKLQSSDLIKDIKLVQTCENQDNIFCYQGGQLTYTSDRRIRKIYAFFT